MRIDNSQSKQIKLTVYLISAFYRCDCAQSADNALLGIHDVPLIVSANRFLCPDRIRDCEPRVLANNLLCEYFSRILKWCSALHTMISAVPGTAATWQRRSFRKNLSENFSVKTFQRFKPVGKTRTKKRFWIFRHRFSTTSFDAGRN